VILENSSCAGLPWFVRITDAVVERAEVYNRFQRSWRAGTPQLGPETLHCTCPVSVHPAARSSIAVPGLTRLLKSTTEAVSLRRRQGRQDNTPGS